MYTTSEVVMLILSKIGVTNKFQQNFLIELFSLLPSIRGRMNFSNLSRYSIFNECTFRRNFSKFFNWVGFNYAIICGILNMEKAYLIAALDASFIPKSGKCTDGLDKFWSGCLSKAKRGLEVSAIALIDVVTGQAFTLDVTQTPSGLSSKEGSQEDYTRIDFYLEQLLDCLPYLKLVSYIAADGYYAKQKVFNAFAALDKWLITKLRSDANLRYLLDRSKHPDAHGNKVYNGKVNWEELDLSKWIDVGVHPLYPSIHVYTQILNSPYFKRNFKIVLLHNIKKDKYFLLACTDLSLNALTIVEYYGLRFQIEFLFRDAKQFTGLTHCQARDYDKLDFHFNMSMSALNVYQMQMQMNEQENKSINTFIRKAYNERLAKMLLTELNQKAKLREFLDIKSPIIQKIINLGQVLYRKAT